MSNRTFWDRIAFAYDAAEALNKKVYQAMLESITNLVPEGAGVLECAAGTGALSIAVAPKAKSVLCTDTSFPMLDKARKKAQRAGLCNISFDERDILSLADGDESFDVVIAANVIHLLDEPHLALAELWRVAKSGGLLIVPTFLTHGSKKGFKFLIRLYKAVGFQPVHNYTEAQYREMLYSSGLPTPDITVIKGKVPVGFAVFRKG